jgi:alpha/beta superfamily hydrolase
MKLILQAMGILDKTRAALAPPRAPIAELARIDDTEVQDIQFETGDRLKLAAWWIAGNSDITIILAHSFGTIRSGWQGEDAAGNSHTINWIPSIEALAKEGYNVLALDHRACGASEGDMTYFGKLEALDIEAAVQWVRTHHGGLNRFAIIGFSSGANAAIRALGALEQSGDLELAGIAVNVYWYQRMIRKSTKFFTSLPLILLPLIKMASAQIVGFDPAQEIDPTKTLVRTSAPVLLVNARDDEIADVCDIEDIYQARPTNTQLVLLDGETRFDAYHFVERHLDQVIQLLNQGFPSAK